MTDTLGYPGGHGYQERWSKLCGDRRLAEELGGVVFASEVELLKRITELIEQCGQKTRALKAAMVRAEGDGDLSNAPACGRPHPAVMEELRKPVDELEVTPMTEPPLPRHSEMLFIL